MIKKGFIYLIKFYKFFISPVLGNNCRYLPTCSEYFIDSLNEYGVLKGCYKGTKRILTCHPVRIWEEDMGMIQ